MNASFEREFCVNVSFKVRKTDESDDNTITKGGFDCFKSKSYNRDKLITVFITGLKLTTGQADFDSF